MRFGYIGISYKNADLDIRDKISFTDVRKMDFLKKMDALGVSQGMILSTCNRSEVFFLGEEDDQIAGSEDDRTEEPVTQSGTVDEREGYQEKNSTEESVRPSGVSGERIYRRENRLMEELQRLYMSEFPDVDLHEYLCTLSGTEAIEYLYRIAAGLESLVLGEDQILGQVKDALEFSRAMGYCGKELDKIVRDAVTCAKKLKTELKISERPLSVSYVGIRQIEKTCGFSGRTVLVIGSGKTSALALKYIYEYGARKVMLCSRTLAHAVDLREEFPDLQIIQYEERYLFLGECDIVVSATSSPHLVIKKSRFQAKQPIVILDLATPRDIDVELQNCENVTLFNLDSLHEIVEQNQKERENLVDTCSDRIREAVRETEEWLLSSRMDPTIESLQQRCNEIVEDSFAYLNRKIELTAREQKIVRKVLDASLHRLLREPIRELKRLDSADKQNEYERIVKELFCIEHRKGEKP